MKQKLLSIFLVCVLMASATFAQDKRITGKVTAREDGLPLPGVSVKVSGTTIGTQTDANGNYSLSIPPTSKSLEFSFIGFSTQNVSIGTKTNINASLDTDAKQLSEVVVTGYGSQNKRDVTGSVSSIKGTQFESLPIQTFDKAMQGRAAGVQVTSNTGQPGGGITVNIRGRNTINGDTQPLYIIDGIQVSPGGLAGQASVNALSSINPADIESIEILKDGAAASIYGAQAGNGVVIVTTKRGNQKGKTQVKFGAQYGTSTQYNPYQVANGNEWFSLRQEALGNYYERIGDKYQTGLDQAAATYFNGTVPASITSYDWVDAIQQTGKSSQYDLSINGGDAKTQFFVSGSYNNTDGTVLASLFKRGTFRANLTHNVNNKLSVETAVALTGSNSISPTQGVGFFSNGAFTGGLFTAPISAIYNADGTFNTSLIGTTTNIVQTIVEEDRKVGTFQTISNLAINYKILPSLKFKAFSGIDFSDLQERNYRPASIPSGASNGGTGAETFRRNVNYNLNSTLTYAKTFGKHNVSALAGYEFRNANGSTIVGGSQGFASTKLRLISSGATPTTANSSYTVFKTSGFFGNARYDYKGKYLANATVRYDGSSRFGADNKFGLFYGLSTGWRISEENFMKDVKFLNDLKLRLSYAKVGVPPTANFGALGLFGNGGQYNGQPGLRPTQLANNTLTWEESNQANIGLDFSFFKSKFYGSVDFYQKNNVNLLLSRQLPGDSGFTSIFENAGEVENKGVDVELGSVNIDTKGLKWTSSFNIGFSENKLKKLNLGLQRIGNTLIVGEALGLLYTYDWAGVNPADGRPMYYDANGNITYSPKTADQKLIGDSNADFFGGFGNTINYKGLSLDALFQYQYGNSSFLQAAQVLEYSGSGTDNQVRSQLERWRVPGQITSVPRPFETGTEPGGYDPTNLSDRFIEKASYIRLKNVTLGYLLPKTLTNKMKISGMSVFVQGLNLVTFTNYRGDDPENTGNNLGAYPNPRTVTAGLSIDL